MKIILIFLTPLLLSANISFAQNVSDNWKVDATGFLHIDWAEKTNVNRVRRMRLLATVQKSKCGSTVEVDMTNMGIGAGNGNNWVEQAFAFCKVSEATTLRVGRLFLGAGYSTPPPFGLKTVNYTNAAPFAAFAYGVQVVHESGSWWTIADISGTSGLDFYRSGQIDRIEISGRSVHTISDTVSHAFNWQVSKDFVRLGTDINWKISPKFNTSGGVYYSNESPAKITGTVLFEWIPIKFMRPHVQADFQPNGRFSETLGIGLYWSDWRFTVDYDFRQKNTFARFQYRFK